MGTAKVILVEKRSVYGRELTYPVTFKKQIEVLTGKQTIDETDTKALCEMGFVVCTEQELGKMDRAYFVMQSRQDGAGNYQALVAVEGERGYYLTDWFWGSDFKVAEQIADKKNAAMGVSKKKAAKIILSSMR